MKRWLVIAATAVFLSVAPCDAKSEEKTRISDGVVKIGMIEDMSSIYADITGVGAVTAAKMAVEDFGGTVLGMPIEVVSADHQNKADIASATAREWFENQHVDALMDVAASATALAAIDVAKTKNKIVVLNGPGAARITNEACTPVSIHYTYDNYALAHGTGGAMVKAGYDTWFFVTADYAFGHDLEQVTAGVIKANGGQVLGGVRVPINTSDFSSALLQAQSSKAKVVGLANAGADTTNFHQTSRRVRHRSRRAETRRPAGVHQRRQQPRPGRGARHVVDQRLSIGTATMNRARGRSAISSA